MAVWVQKLIDAVTGTRDFLDAQAAAFMAAYAVMLLGPFGVAGYAYWIGMVVLVVEAVITFFVAELVQTGALTPRPPDIKGVLPT